MNKKDEEIQRKLEELENTILKETSSKPQTPSVPIEPTLLTTNKTAGSTSETVDVKNDLCYFGGIASIVFGLFLLFQNVRVSSGGFSMMFGMSSSNQGIGLMVLPLIFGIGWLMYDSKSKAAWMVTAGSCAVLALAIIASLGFNFLPLTLVQLIMVLFPFALGGALLLRGMGGPKAIEAKLKKGKS